MAALSPAAGAPPTGAGRGPYPPAEEQAEQEAAGRLRLFIRRALVEFLTARGFGCERVRGAPYHDVPRPLRPLDRSLSRWPSLASILLVQARRR